jgi:hypothetical protein
MLRKCLFLSLVVSSLILLPVAVGAGGKAVERPMKLTGMGLLKTDFDPMHWEWRSMDTAVIPWVTEEAGEGTHLGEWKAICPGGVLVRLLPGGGIELLEMWGDWEFTADNGDKLSATLVWPSYPVIQETATATITGGTGRFEGASGTLTLTMGYTGEQWWDGTDHYSTFWETVEGTITY